jgi:hypothetical protein
VQSGRLLASVRKAISAISGYYGFSRVVAGGSILARRAVNTNWEGPHNVDWCHFGAMRGLDFAKYHAAAISVGRMELPVRIVDGLVAALTYDDDEPERPYDRFGTGLNEAGQPLLVPSGNQLVRMRSGHDLHMPVPMFPGRWGRMIQKQYREEELLQFLGRLRPVYREGDAPIWFSLSSVIPEEVIVDDLINMDDLLQRNGVETPVWEAMRRCRGLLDVDLIEKTCADIFTSPKAAVRFLSAEGINPRTGELTPRLSWSLSVIRWTDAAGAAGYSFARGDISDPVAALRNARAELGLAPLASAEKTGPAKPQGAARGRVPDKIENELGTLEERRDLEHKQQLEVAVRELMAADPESIKHLKVRKMDRMVPISLSTGVPRGDDEDSQPIMSNLIEIEAKASIEALWRSKGYDPDAARAEAAMQGNGTVSDDRIVKIGERADDRSQEFDLYRFDEFDMAVPF